MDGVLLIDKSAGWTSHDVVAKIRSVIKVETGQKLKVGHTGTLDPFATGLLIIVLGSYTKRASDFSKLDKVYEAELSLGAVSSTGDIDGDITPKSAKKPSLQQIKKVLTKFIGEIQQTPPAYSAVKIGGQRAYKLARKGQKPELEPRKVIIYEISLLSYEYPKLQIRTRVSSGTYIRSLAEDIGQSLGSGAHLSRLRRLAVGNFSLNSSITIDQLGYQKLVEHLAN